MVRGGRIVVRTLVLCLLWPDQDSSLTDSVHLFCFFQKTIKGFRALTKVLPVLSYRAPIKKALRPFKLVRDTGLEPVTYPV